MLIDSWRAKGKLRKARVVQMFVFLEFKAKAERVGGVPGYPRAIAVWPLE